MSDELKPCPFCGGDAEIREGEEMAYVQCLRMSMHKAIFYDGDNNAAAEVAEQWNRRTGPTICVGAATVQKLTIEGHVTFENGVTLIAADEFSVDPDPLYDTTRA